MIPKFFQHFGPKINRTFSFRTPSSGSEKKDRSAIVVDQASASERFKRPFAKKTHLGDTSSSGMLSESAEPKSGYFSLDDYDIRPSGTVPKSAMGVNTRRADLESAPGDVPF